MITNTIDDRLKEPCPPAATIFRFLSAKDCGIRDVTPCEFKTLPALRFCYDSDGIELRRILTESRYIILEDKGECITTLSYKKKKLIVERGTVFTVPADFKTRGRIVTKVNPDKGKDMGDGTLDCRELLQERVDVLRPGLSYALLRFPPDNEMRSPYVIEVDMDSWGLDPKGNADRANEAKEGSQLSFEEMRWVYRTALLSMDLE